MYIIIFIVAGFKYQAKIIKLLFILFLPQKISKSNFRIVLCQCMYY